MDGRCALINSEFGDLQDLRTGAMACLWPAPQKLIHVL